jgi:choline dehydrogenase
VSNGADIVIVGGGAAGCVVARRVAQATAASVLLVEAGPDLRGDTSADLHDGWRLPVPPDWGFDSEPSVTGATGKLRRGRLLGGTSWLTRFAVRGSAADFDAWATAGNPGWGWNDVLPTFRRIESDAEFGRDPIHGDSGPIPITRYPDLRRSDIHQAAIAGLASLGFPSIADHNEPHALGVGPLPMSSRRGTRVTTTDAYLSPEEVPANLVVRPDSLVDCILLEGNRATGVRLVDGVELRAAQIVLCAGTYGSPAILMRSGIGPAQDLVELGINVHIDLPGVGANLADHPGVDLDSGWHGAGTAGPIHHSIATFRSARATSPIPDMMFWLSDPDEKDPAFFVDPILLKPSSRGTVRLRSSNPADPPRITLPDPRQGADLERLIEGYERGIELANRKELTSVSAGPPPRDPGTRDGRRRAVSENAYSLPHVVGTCRMGPSAADGGVVDADGRVHGVTGLFVADASVIPDAPSGFPHLVTIMLAEHLVARWSAKVSA